jgi:hypothetical protein
VFWFGYLCRKFLWRSGKNRDLGLYLGILLYTSLGSLDGFLLRELLYVANIT